MLIFAAFLAHICKSVVSHKLPLSMGLRTHFFIDQPEFDELRRIQRDIAALKLSCILILITGPLLLRPCQLSRLGTSTLTPHHLLPISIPPTDRPRLNKLMLYGSAKPPSLSIEVRLREPDASAAVVPRIRRREE
jgi:hypothetical protein